ncbi:MAG: hypothetical protein ACR2FG_07950 [Marmoricola sp.]
MFLAEVDDIGAGRFEDPQPEQAEHGATKAKSLRLADSRPAVSNASN